MIKYVTGNFFDYDADIRVNTVNCVGVMGAGVALQFKKTFPKMYKEYVKECKLGNVKIGVPHVWQNNEMFSDKNVIIINFPTKDHWRNPSEYEYVEKGLLWLKDFLQEKTNITITVPALGCGHGGLDWQRVKSMINYHLSDLSATILVFEPQSSIQIDEDLISDDILEDENILRIFPHENNYPSKLKGTSASLVYLKGDNYIFDQKILSIIVDSKADNREKAALLKCIEELPVRSFVFGAGFNSSFEIDIVKTLLEKNARVLLFLPYGILRLKIRKDLVPVWNENMITLISSSNPYNEWKINQSIDSLKLRIKISDAILISNHKLNSIQKFERDFTESHNSIFFINYWNDSKEFFNRISARKIGRDRNTHKPNISPILHELE